MPSGYTVTGRGDLDSIFKAKSGSAASATGYKVGGVDLNQFYEPRGSTTPVAATGFQANGTDLAQIFMGIGGQDVNLSNGLISAWLFDPGSSTNVEAGDGLADSKAMNSLQIGGANMAIKNYRFNGGTGLSCGSGGGYATKSSAATNLSTTSYTFGGWLDANLALAAGRQTILMAVGTSAGSTSFYAYFNSDTGAEFVGAGLVFRKTTDGTTTQEVAVSAAAMNASTVNAWGNRLLLFWVDTSAQTMNIQVSNGAVTSTSIAGALGTYNPAQAIHFFRAPSIGISSSSSANTESVLSNWFYYNRAINAAERAALWNGGTGLVPA